jgi:flagellar basal body-associated protein FliL
MAKSRKSKSKGGSSILVIIAVLTLLAAIGVAIYKLSGQHERGRNEGDV